jgi:hypothetical protein
MLSRRRILPLAAVALAALGLAACGDRHQPTTTGESEGEIIKAGPLLYQVQLSRELNPANVEDREYLSGLAAGTPQPTGREEWFGVWLRVQNTTDRNRTSAREFKIVDTLGTEYEPVALSEDNPFAYRPGLIEAESGQPVAPDPESGAGGGPIQGSMLLFKLDTSVYGSRPIEFEITPPSGGEPSRVTLDL